MPDTRRQRRPRREFDRDAGVAKAQALFHARGYDGVGVAALTEALDINPPSLYTAYGSKLGLFERAMERYVSEQALPLGDVFREGRPLGEAIAQLFAAAADQYSRNSACPGCLVTEGARAADPDARAAALKVAQQMTQAINAAIALRSPDMADRLTDFVVTTLRGFSAAAYAGLAPERLKRVAELSGELLIKELDRA
ncbi:MULTISPECIES: TetR/AcrR family transcriptional regulator [Roseobacteraceae]|uniref:HTH-type transcriptional repressor BdcR n=1 Tax=Pseudosulfitobacter pseudonitzschiae TaxID=1402135 RepID=A0A221K841_9RHOB|nr:MULTISPECIES: TetR/AcrR family transcriptional regulator [Roseobacteraceae]ASM75027.1 HTH-type transcriptional repressor BdcR [Pseudosulfitobacter pseudonitzschiae]